ncbi:SPO14 regulatory factor 1 [Hyphodiscus hymeniophilus]|uniref:SPO14 regulatory factor 1 n=1 Tax=Hyphodiscus hymeniophilus TaxID=353542 RepID=A0A9P6VJU7_9HELO|nr:SPO14 regulatory factor 1 [Hyphodiscus hymeniophilus]
MAPSEDLTGTFSAQGPTLEAHHILQHDSIPSERQHSGSLSSSNQGGVRGKRADQTQDNRPTAYSSSSRNTQSSSSTRAETRSAQRDVRTLPPWIDSFEDGEASNTKPTDGLLSSPSKAHPAQHNFAPSNPERRISHDGYVDTYDDAAHGMAGKRHETGFFGVHREPVKGRKWDHARDGDPVIMQSGILPTSSPWRTYIKASMYGPGQIEDGERKDEQFLQEQTPGYEKPWRGDLECNDDPDTFANLLHNRRRQRTLIKRAQHLLLMHPLIPLIFRIIVLTTSSIALALSGSVHHFSTRFHYPQSPSTVMAIVVDIIAIPYICYITWDEYTGKPLGLRSPKAKIRLVLLDLFFIIFESANLSLAFGAVTDDNGASLIAWSLTFAVSIFRLVERVGGREEGD